MHGTDAGSTRSQPPSHGHGHGHQRNPSALARARHLLADAFGTHSHDSADQVDDALEADAQGRRALWISLAALGATALVQAVVVSFTGSVALLGDTLHNVADALTAVPLLIAFALARRPRSARFTHGFGRAEDLAGVFVVAMIALSAVLAGYEAVKRLVHPEPMHHLALVAAAAVVGFVGNEAVARYRIVVGRRIGSAALVADGLHARADGMTSLAVLLGAGGVALGWQRADPVVGLLIALMILRVLWSAAVQVGARLLDAVDPTLVATARAAVSSHDGVQEIRELRLRWIGHDLRAEIAVVADGSGTLRQADELARAVEAELRARVRRLSSVIVQVCPGGD